jgi:hypothetical protein
MGNASPKEVVVVSTALANNHFRLRDHRILAGPPILIIEN